MKTIFAAQIAVMQKGSRVEQFPCRITSRRRLGALAFLDLSDSTGKIEAVVEKSYIRDETWRLVVTVGVGSIVLVDGFVEGTEGRDPQLRLEALKIIVPSESTIQPSLDRASLSFLRSSKGLARRHLYVRHPYFLAILRAKSELKKAFCNTLDSEGLIEVDLPILTMTTLYDSSGAFSLDYFGTQVYLSQCASLYLAACTQALERTYTIAPAFRAVPSRSPRHNPEFWHIKGQIAFCDLNEIMDFVSECLFRTVRAFSESARSALEHLGVALDLTSLEPPYPVISYSEACEIIKASGHSVPFGRSLGPKEEEILMWGRSKPLFVVGLPATTEPFPYALSSISSEYTRTADLLAPGGYGEILGVAEFETNSESLRRRLQAHGHTIPNIAWYLELLDQPTLPFSGFGLGIERVLRWLLGLPHIKDTFAFPRLYRRLPYP